MVLNNCISLKEIKYGFLFLKLAHDRLLVQMMFRNKLDENVLIIKKKKQIKIGFQRIQPIRRYKI